ncbi:carbohydrate ABC transporter permease [Nocardia lijiangensis]|uniref:carbohydrate ABC transporter permease n=1 Tax=Nocardia lijiangensis TaxID=299618 RepID=UPI00083207FB|nr:carbohydrate ABC transporter permease [Nocardia lijiangensis]
MTTPPGFLSNGLHLELATRRMRGALIGGRNPWRGWGWARVAPAWLLAALLLVASGWTVAVAGTRVGVPLVLVLAGAAILVARRLFAHGTPRVVAVVAAAGLLLAGPLLFVVDASADTLAVYGRTLLFVLGGFGLMAAALVTAWWSRGVRWLWLPLVLPFGVAAFVSGLAFRVMFEAVVPEGDVATFQAGYRWMPLMAFWWTWFGFLTGMFSAGLRAIETDPVRWGYLNAPTGRFRFAFMAWRGVRLVHPVVLIAGIAAVVAAARVFDVILIGIPAAYQYGSDSATVRWWRLATTDSTAAEVAIYSVPLAVLVGVCAFALGKTGGPRELRLPLRPRSHEPQAARRPGGVVTGFAVLMSFVSVVPLLMLAWVSMRRPDGLGWPAIGRVWEAGLPSTLAVTALVATVATVLAVSAALPVARWLSATPSDTWRARLAMTALVVLAVLPAQMYLGPIDEVSESLGLSGTQYPLMLVHGAAGLPVSVLILRGAMRAAEENPSSAALHGLARPGAVARRLWDGAGRAVVTAAVLEFILVWNDFFVSLMISGAGVSPWSLLLWGEARQYEENLPQLAAGALVFAIVPVVLLLATWRRFLVPGLTGGALR